MDGTHLIDGAAGTPHISALDVRTHNATLFGDGVYITDGLDGLPIAVTDANTLTIGRGCMLVNGARITQESLLKLTIESGQQGVNRNDLLVGTYTYDGANTRLEDVNFEIVTGTPTSGTAKDPTIHSGTLLDINGADLVNGISTVQFPIARIPIEGITVGTPVVLAKKFTSVESLRDSVSLNTVECKKTGISSSDRIYVSKLGSLAVLWGTASMTLSAAIPTWRGMQIAVIPEGYRPASELRVPIVSDADAATMSLKPSGAVEVVARANKISGNVTISAVYPLAL